MNITDILNLLQENQCKTFLNKLLKSNFIQSQKVKVTLKYPPDNVDPEHNMRSPPPIRCNEKKEWNYIISMAKEKGNMSSMGKHLTQIPTVFPHFMTKSKKTKSNELISIWNHKSNSSMYIRICSSWKSWVTSWSHIIACWYLWWNQPLSMLLVGLFSTLTNCWFLLRSW